MLSLSHKNIFITGAGAGIGQATAIAFAQQNSQLILAGRNIETVKETATKVKEISQKTPLCLACDVSKEDDVIKAMATIEKEFGHLDGAFNNAGIAQGGNKIADITSDEWNNVININLNGVFYCLKHEIPLMEKNGGSIVNNASAAGMIGFPGASAYCASKFGVVGLSRVAALDYGDKNIRVNAICPGPIQTRMIDSFAGGEEGLKTFISTLPIKRLGKPEEIAQTVVFLCSDGAGNITGATLPVDGGQTTGLCL